MSNKNALPGFAAEASLYKTSGHYRPLTGQAGATAVPGWIVPQLQSSQLSDATCSKDPVFGNVICDRCTTGPFPRCTVYVCDRNGDNCKATSRALAQVFVTSGARPLLVVGR